MAPSAATSSSRQPPVTCITRLRLPAAAFVLDVSNACLGLLNGVVLVADMIELGQIRAGLIVGTEDGRGFVESTIDSLFSDDRLTRQEMKADFASLTIGSGSAAIVLSDRSLSGGEHRLLGGAFRADTTNHELCTGGDAAVPAATHSACRPIRKPS